MERQFTKEELVATIDPTKTYLGSLVIDKIRKLEGLDIRVRPSYPKRGDVILIQTNKLRPCVIITVNDDAKMCICLPLTSGENIHNLCKSNSRFFGSGYFANKYEVVTIDYACDRYVGVYDNEELILDAEKRLYEFINRVVLPNEFKPTQKKAPILSENAVLTKRPKRLYEYDGKLYKASDLFRITKIAQSHLCHAFKDSKSGAVKVLKSKKIKLVLL